MRTGYIQNVTTFIFLVGAAGVTRGDAAALPMIVQSPPDLKSFRTSSRVVPRDFSIPRGFMGDFSTLFNDFKADMTRPYQVLEEDDGQYAGERHIPYITVPSHLTFGKLPTQVASKSHRQNRQQVLNDPDVEDTTSTAVTIFTQASLDRIDMLPDLVHRWDGHVSVALYVESFTDLPALSSALRFLHTEFMNLSEEKYVSVSLLFGLKFLIALGYEYGDAAKTDKNGGGTNKGGDYLQSQNRVFHPYDFLFPINSLRNLALSQCATDLVMSLDIDFLPSFRAHSALTTKSLVQLLQSNDTVLVVSAFEFNSEPLARDRIFPSLTMPYLREACMAGTVIPFHAKEVATASRKRDRSTLRSFCQGKQPPPPHLKITPVQMATNYKEFFRTLAPGGAPDKPQEPYLASLPTNFGRKGPLDRKYEPYILANKDTLPPFDETFRGYGFNKRSHSIALQVRGVKFYVVRGVFVVHRPHPSSDSKISLEGVIKKTVGRAYRRFLSQLRGPKGQVAIVVD
ncbi:hypothetical protein HDU96_010548 [Phlyctochytrium bullatum]|nr:hypothetical protein HDU96_010548 [Phlyctochytrium bullatum]